MTVNGSGFTHMLPKTKTAQQPSMKIEDKQLSIEVHKKEHRNCPLCPALKPTEFSLQSLGREEGESSRH